jgi:aerobic C4-dicarboxylate transport protein
MRFYRRTLYLWVLLAIALGAAIGHLDPETGIRLKPLGDGFISLIRFLVPPIVFCTVVLGIAGGGTAGKVGRVGLKAILYFEVVSTLALGIGLAVGNLLKPGAGFGADPARLDGKGVEEYIHRAGESSILDAFAHSLVLQTLVAALAVGLVLNLTPARGAEVRSFLKRAEKLLFRAVAYVMLLAPFGAGGAMAFTIGRYGLRSLRPMASLMGCFYLTCLLFIFLVLGGIARLAGFRIGRFVLYLKEEILTVLGTSSSESVLAPLMDKLERLGCSRPVVGLVVPSGYSFNLDGTNIYLTLAALFIAQALGVDLPLGQQLTLFGVAMIVSKGATGVTGSGFVTLAATLAVVPSVPPAGLALILGIDRFMSEARAITNMIGNGVATVVISRWEGELDHARLKRELSPRLGQDVTL